MTVRWTALVLGLFVATASAAAEPIKVGGVVIETPWARASPGAAKTGAVYLTLSNHGTAPDQLVGAATPVAAKAGLHTHMMHEGIMKMRPVKAIEVAPGTPTVLRPGGLHIMLMGLTGPLKEGDSFPLTLSFRTAGPVEVQVTVAGIGAMGPGGQKHGHGQGDVPTD